MILFLKDEDNLGGIHINNYMVMAIKEFRDVWKTKKTTKGDADGRKKVVNKKELLYIFYRADVTKLNMFAGMNEDIVKDKAKEACKLDEDWKEDYYVSLAIEKYKEVQQLLSPTTIPLHNAKVMLRSTGELLNTLNKQNQTLNKRVLSLTGKLKDNLEIEDRTPEIETAASTLAIALNEANGLIEANINRVLELSAKIDKALDRIHKMETKLVEESSKNKLAIGGRKIGNREIPKKRDFI